MLSKKGVFVFEAIDPLRNLYNTFENGYYYLAKRFNPTYPSPPKLSDIEMIPQTSRIQISY